MPDVLKGQAFWDGVEQVISATMTLTQGISPSVCIMEIVLQPPEGIAEYGDLLFTFGNEELPFADCKVDKATFRYGASGMVIGLHILDRRWKWAFDWISGNYNERRPSVGLFGSIDADTEASPQQLAGFLLDELGETDYDVSALPDDARPEVRWDHDNPAQELEKLANGLSCRVCLGTDDVVRLCRQGEGADLPTEDVLREQDVLDPPEVPDSLLCVGGPTEHQVDFLLEAVGLDTDRVIRPIDQLSYTPAAGWARIFPDKSEHGFQEVVGYTKPLEVTQGLSNILTFGLINPRQLARETVYSWYRIKMVDIDGTGRLPLIPGWQGGANGTGGPGRIEALWQILPLIEHQVRGYFDVAGKFVPFPVWVWGVFYDDQMAFGNTQPGSFYHADFTVDVEQGLVKFSNLTMLLNPDGSWAPAKLAMRCSVRVRDYDARFIERYERSLLLTPTGGTHDTGPKVIKREEIVLYTLPIYNDAHAVTQLLSNGVQANQEADYNLTVAAADFNTVTPQDVTYMGLKDISPDGAITQATVDVSPGGTTTRAARNTEWHPAVPSYRERRQMELLQAGLPVVQQLQDQSRKG